MHFFCFLWCFQQLTLFLLFLGQFWLQIIKLCSTLFGVSSLNFITSQVHDALALVDLLCNLTNPPRTILYPIHSPRISSTDFKTGDKKVIIGPFWREVFTETYEDHEEDLSTTTSEPLPFFEDDASTNNVTAQLGSRVHLHCRVHDLGEKTVS